MPNQPDTQTWPELAIGLYEKLTGRDAEISYCFEDFTFGVPSSTHPDAEQARWNINGTVGISTRNGAVNEGQG